MTLESQVVSLDLAKRLKELGVKQESAFYWACFLPEHEGFERLHFSVKDSAYKPATPEYLSGVGYSAFTVAELGEMLPGFIDLGLKDAQMRMFLKIGRTFANGWRIDYENGAARPISEFGETESEGRAKMLVYLIEQGIVKP